LIVFSFCSINLGATAYANDLLEMADDSLLYLNKNVLSIESVNDIDIAEAELAVNTLNQILKKYDLTEESVFLIREYTGKSVYLINLKRYLNGIQVDVNQVERVKADLDYVISKSSNPKELMFTAGHNALHMLQTSPLAYKYWEKCASLGHAGCMNIMAQHRFTGENGLPVNISASIGWHQKVFKTQIQYNCAGIYSSNTLMQIAYHFEHSDTGNTWKNWQIKRNLLLKQLKETERFEQESYCSLINLLVTDFVLSRGAGMEEHNILDNAIKLTTDVQHINSLIVMKDGQDAAMALEFLPYIKDDMAKCTTSLNLALYAKYNQQERAFSLINNYMTTLDSQYCAWELALKQHMQTAGHW
jgi:hypothetical protein